MRVVGILAQAFEQCHLQAAQRVEVGDAQGERAGEAAVVAEQFALRDIPVYEGWVDESCAELGQTVDDFVESIQKILDKKVDKREAGYLVASSRSIDKVSHQLADAYRQVMEL